MRRISQHLALLPLLSAGCDTTVIDRYEADPYGYVAYVDLTGNYTADATITTYINGIEVSTEEAKDIRFAVSQLGPAVDWFGVTGLALPDRVIFGTYTRVDAVTQVDAMESLWYTLTISGQATSSRADVNLHYVFYTENNVEILDLQHHYDFEGIEQKI